MLENRILVAVLILSIIMCVFTCNGYKASETSEQLNRETIWMETHQVIRY